MVSFVLDSLSLHSPRGRLTLHGVRTIASRICFRTTNMQLQRSYNVIALMVCAAQVALRLSVNLHQVAR